MNSFTINTTISTPEFTQVMQKRLAMGIKDNKLSVEKLAKEHGIHDKTLVKELTELAIVNRARDLALQPDTVADRFNNIVGLYASQVNLSHRTSQSILLQQYSTPAPIAYLAGVFCGIDKFHHDNKIAFEPSAGNGLLTIAGWPHYIYLNEIGELRNLNLHTAPYASITKKDASQPFKEYYRKFDAVLTNPPFGKGEVKKLWDGFPIKPLEHIMALIALDTMKDNGKAAIIIGGHTVWDDLGRIQAGKNRIFFNYMYSRYNVVDVINIDGHKLYSRQGTSFNVRLILIDGRKAAPFGAAPIFNSHHDIVIRSFDELYQRVMAATQIKNYIPMNLLELEAEALTLELALSGQSLGKANSEEIVSSIYQRYITTKKKYQSLLKVIVLVPSDTADEYETFGSDAETIAMLCTLKLSSYSLIDNKKVYGLTIGKNSLKKIIRQLQASGYIVAVMDNYKSLSGDDNDDDSITDFLALYHRYNELKEVYPNDLLLMETPELFVSYQEDAIRLAKALNMTYIEAKGKDYYYTTAAFSKIRMAERIEQLQKANITFTIIPNGKPTNWEKIEKDALEQIKLHGGNPEELGAPYLPASQACVVLDTQVPDSMAFETHQAMQQIKEAVGGDIDNFVRHRLKYPTKAALCKVLSAEQIDAVAMAIYNIEARNQGTIIGDQTGIGKGRIAAAMIRYAVGQGLQPVFLTEKANLFSDIYRDLEAIGSAHLQPFIVNTKESKTDIKDQDGNIIYSAPPPTEQKTIIEEGELPGKYDFILATYSQFNSAEKKPEKPNFLRAVAEDNIFIMDEAHNSSGSSNTGSFMQKIVSKTKGVVFLSATFAKRPDNLPIYAMKTAISDCNMSKDNLVDAITRGGVALQEVLSAQLVAEGQMIRRERSFEGIEVNYLTLHNKAEEHKAISDNATSILRDIIAFQTEYVDKEVKELDKIAVAEGKEMELRKGTSQAGVDNTPYFSKVFNVINQMLFSIKAEAVAEQAIARLKEGKKPVIAFASTMGSFIETLENENGMTVTDGDTINADFAEVLKRGLDGVLRYTEKDVDGTSVYKKFVISDFSPAAQIQYRNITEKINRASTGITISPIDVVIKKIKEAGYSVAEVTGRKYELQLNAKGTHGVVLSRKKINTNDAFREFNNNEVDVLMINQAGSTGASAHAIVTAKVSKEQVKQRVMIVLQAELDISTEVQKRGRINRTGQILKPVYDYVTSAIPAERRLMMMLQKKLKSLDANTTSNQKQSSNILDVPDFLNKYGDKVVKEYLSDNPEVNKLLDDPLYMEESGADSGSGNTIEDAAMKVSGRVAVLSTQMQEDFYNDIAERYSDLVDYLKQTGDYDLEVEAMDLQAETISAKVFKMGKGTDSAFGEDSILETIKANVLTKPLSKTEVQNILTESLQGGDAKVIQDKFYQQYKEQTGERLQLQQKEVDQKYDGLIADVPNEARIKKLPPAVQDAAIAERKKQLEEAREMQLEENNKTASARKYYMEKALQFFYIGRYVNYPAQSYSGGSEVVPAIFLGYQIDQRKKNPYTASAIKLRFAIASSAKYIALPASYNETIMAIIGASHDLKEVTIPELLNAWEKFLEKNISDRKIRHVVTGNLLQASSDMKGKLVSYTTIDNKVKKGILLPENWDKADETQNNVVVPIIKALPIIKSLVHGNHIVTNNGLSIFKNGTSFKLITSASRSKGGEIYLDEEILKLVDNNNFEKTSDKMVAELPEENIGKLITILQNTHSAAITIGSHQLKDLDKASLKLSNRKPILLPPLEEPEQENDTVRMLELEAEALSLELELLAA
jgi:hypothetical protein